MITSPRRVTTPRSPEEARAEVEKYIRADRLQKIYPDQATLEHTIELLQHPTNSISPALRGLKSSRHKLAQHHRALPPRNITGSPDPVSLCVQSS